MSKITINHVFSNDVQSKIFDDLLGYHQRFASGRFDFMKSVSPVHGAWLRHYHRPNVERSLLRPCVVTVHHDLAETDEWLDFAKFEESYRQADTIICLNSLQQRFLADRGFDNTIRIPHGFNETFLRPVARHFDGERKLWLGIFSRRYGRKVKGEAYIYELAKRLHPSRFGFFLVGQGRSVDARFLGSIGYEVRCYEALPYSTFCTAYQKIDFLLMASVFEGGPANIPEAVATQTPIIANPVGMAHDHLENGANGIALSMDPERDAAILMDLARHPEQVHALYAGARARAGAAIPWREVVTMHEAEYSRLIRNALGQP